MSKPDSRPERAKTDESLADERAKADDAIAEKAAVEQVADEVIELARDKADEVLTTARAKADDKLHCSADDDPAVVEKQRATEDRKLDALRNRADDVLRAERAASARLLASLIPLERDKTDLHLLSERARSDAALASRDNFLGMVSHDLRDLLTSIVMTAAAIGQRGGSEEERATTLGSVDRIQRAAGRMSRLIGDLVDVASIDAGKLAIVATPSNAVAAVLEAIETWEPHAVAKALTLEAAAAEPVPAKFDHERILQILGNLITNAIKFSPPGGAIVVGVEALPEKARFFVKDSGAGIAADKQEAIFERFWQVGKNDRRGLGLGLYISERLVHAHGGEIWVESAPGSGSTFFFTVPTPA